MSIRRIRRPRYYSIPHRCTRCQARISIRLQRGHTFEDRARRPKCATCGHRKFYVDKWRIKVENKRPCHCGGYPFPHAHKRGYCYQSPRAPELWAARFEGAAA